MAAARRSPWSLGGTMRILLRQIRTADAETVATIHATSWRSAYRGILRNEFLDEELLSNRLALWTKRLSPILPSHFGFLATVGPQDVGFAFAFGANDPYWGTQVDNLHVLPALTGQGIGRCLLASLCTEAERLHPNIGVYLWVYEQNTPAQRFYERFGAISTERAVIPAPGGGEVGELRYCWQSPTHALQGLKRAA
jgi:GNAT superfamily N-acetyltransferase